MSPRHNPPLALMLVVFGAYLLTMSGHVYSPDEETMLALSRSLVERGSWAMEPVGGLFQVEGIDGRLYSEKGPGQSFFAVPWTALGLLLGSAYPPPQSDFALQFVLGAYNALIGAGIAGLTAALGLAMGYSRRAALFVGGALAFATFLWPTSRTFFAEPLLGLLLLASFYLLYIGFDRQRKLGAITNPQPPTALLFALSGVFFAWAVAVKVQGAIALPAYLLYIALRSRRRMTNDEGQTVEEGQPAVDTDSLPFRHSPFVIRLFSSFRITHYSLPWLIGLGVGIAPYLLYNWLAFGSPFATGYGYGTSITNFDTPLYEGVYGLLVSPGKGLLWYAPPVIIALWGWGKFMRRHRAEAWFAGALALIMLAVFGSFAVWHGDGAWGPRFLVPLLPFALLPSLPVVQRALGGRLNPSRLTHHISRFTLSILLALGFFVNLLGVLVNFDTYLNVGYDGQTRYWYPYASPIVGHLGLLDVQLRGASLRVFPRSGTAYLLGGFSYSEGNKARGNLLPRWTTGEGALEIRAGSVPISITLRLADHRPPELPRANVTVLVDGVSVPVERGLVEGQPSSADYSFTLAKSPARVVVRSDTWNPSDLPGGGRDETLGVSLERVTATEGGTERAYTIVEAMPAPPYNSSLLWYYDLRTPFVADWWPVYMAEAQMGLKGLLLLALPLLAVAGTCLGVGLWGLRSKSQA